MLQNVAEQLRGNLPFEETNPDARPERVIAEMASASYPLLNKATTHTNGGGLQDPEASRPDAVGAVVTRTLGVAQLSSILTQTHVFTEHNLPQLGFCTTKWIISSKHACLNVSAAKSTEEA